MRRAAVPICLLLCLAWALPRTAAAPPSAPARPAPADAPGPLGPPSTLLMEVSTGRVLEASLPHRRLPPASLDKLMTLYLTMEAIRAGHLALDTPVVVSAEAWRIGRTPGSSRMFLNVGDTVTVSQLLTGLMVASGNDAAEALAEAVGGTSERFVAEMNAAAARLEMRDTHYVSPHGLPAPGEYTSAWDVALLARRVLLDFPVVVRFTRPRYEIYAGIRQANWNNLVFRDSRVDGLKTGHTAEAGYSIAATARRGEMRLVAVVMGAPTLRRRTELAEGMLEDGFSRYVLTPVPWQRIVPAALGVYGGTAGRLPLETAGPVRLLTTRDDRAVLEVAEAITVRPLAPFYRGQRVGLLTIRRDGQVVATAPLLAAQAVGRAGIVGRLWGLVRYAAGRLLRRHPSSWRGTYTLQG